MVLKKILESTLDCKKVQPVHCKGNQSWIFIGRTDAGAETPNLWAPEMKNWPCCCEKIEGGRRKRQRMRWLDDITNENLMCLSRPQEFWLWTGRPGVLQSMWLQRVRHNWATELNFMRNFFVGFFFFMISKLTKIKFTYLSSKMWWIFLKEKFGHPNFWIIHKSK